MDVKTLSTVIGHVSSSTTLNIYAHITDEMRQTAARKIDYGIGKAESTPETKPTARKFTPFLCLWADMWPGRKCQIEKGRKSADLQKEFRLLQKILPRC